MGGAHAWAVRMHGRCACMGGMPSTCSDVYERHAMMVQSRAVGSLTLQVPAFAAWAEAGVRAPASRWALSGIRWQGRSHLEPSGVSTQQAGVVGALSAKRGAR